MTSIEKLLYKHGPMLSGQVGELLKSETRASPEAIRKQLSRASGEVKKLRGFFTSNQSFMYLQEQVLTPTYFNALVGIFPTAARRFHAIIQALRLNKGILKEQELANYSFSPIKNLKGHKRFDLVVAELIRLRVINYNSDEKIYFLNPDVFDIAETDATRSKALEVARGFIINQFADWAKKTGLISFDKAEFNSEFGKFQWGFTGPSYVGTLASYANNKMTPGFVTADVILNDRVSEEDISFFIQKVTALKAVKGYPRFIPFLLVDSVSEDALTILKKNGIIVGFFEKIFGKGYKVMLRDLINTVTNAGAILKNNPDQFIELLKKIDALVDGKTNNLRGELFEMTVGYFHGKKAQNIDIGKKIWVGPDLRELDVKAVYDDKIIIAECKAYRGKIEKETIEAWVEKIQIIRKWISGIEVYQSKRLVFEFWAIGGFSIDAQAMLEKAAGARKYDFHYFNKEEILKKARKHSDPKFLEIIKEYFIKDPV